VAAFSFSPNHKQNNMTQTTLYYREGSSDKVYQTWIETSAEGCIVRFAYGRRGTTLTTGMKTPEPVPLGKATSIYEKLIREKTAKGYRPGEGAPNPVSSGSEGEDSGVRCQLLNPNAYRYRLCRSRDNRYYPESRIMPGGSREGLRNR
jgi:predicted DNA-binding WGR domain protein